MLKQTIKNQCIILLFILLLNACVSEQPLQIKRTLVSYSASNIVGEENKQILVDSEFLPCINKINNYAKQNNIIILVTSSFRRKNQQIVDAIVPPSIKSNHFVGHAIDMNVIYNNTLYESRSMKKEKWKDLPVNVRNFLSQVRNDPVLYWGGDFKVEDTVHIDDHLVETDPEHWQKLYNIYQNQ